MGWTHLFWDWRGRNSRRHFWCAQAILWVAYLTLTRALDAYLGYGATLVPVLPMLWALGAVSAKRCHDRGKSALWIAALLIPVVGPLWYSIDLGLLRGERSGNRYGPESAPGYSA